MWANCTKLKMKMLVLIVVALSSCFITTSKVDAAEPFETLLGSFNGVAAYSNCDNNCVECNNFCQSFNYVNGIYVGIKWQCVEYVRRYYLSIYGLDLASMHRGDANTWYDSAANMGLDSYINGGSNRPQIGDILVSNEGDYGHVGIVRSVSDSQVCTIQQNFLNDSSDVNRCLTLTVTEGNYTVAGFSSAYPVHGWLRNPLRCPDIPQDLSLARIQGQDPVYWLQNGKAYHVLSMEIINDMSDIPGWGYVCDYSSDVLEITPAGTPPAEGAFEQGPDFISTNPESNDLLIQLPDDPKVYLIEDGERRWITTDAVFNNLGYDWGDVIVITQAILNLIPEGEPITDEPEFYLLSGTLTNADGVPVPGWVYASETTGANLGNRVYSSDGTYEMALFPGTYRVYAQAYYSYPSGSYSIRTPFQTIAISANSTLNIEVPSYTLYHLTGKVSDTNGVGLANISVQANDSTGTCQSYTTTDDNGSYDALLIGGTYSLHFRPPQDSIFLEKRVNNVPIYSDTTQNISLNSSEHRLSGTLTHTDGSPAQGYVYANEVSGATYRYVWSSDGTYQMALVPGNYRVYAHAYTYYTPGHTRITTPYQTVTVSGDTHHNIDVPSHDLYHLTGKVTDINDIIQSNVRINAYDSSGICYGYTTTAADGSYELMLISGTYRLRISAPPATYPPFEIKKLTIAGDSVRNIRLSLEYTLLEEALALLPDDLDIALDVFDIIDQADALNYDIYVQGAKGLLQIILNWAGSEMKVTLYDPNGNVYGEYQSTEPPINVEITNPTEGTWKCEVTAVDVPHDNYPFALVAGISPNESPVADANGPYSGAVDSPIIFDASSSYDLDGNIVSYEWDWDGNGNFDESTDSATITHTWIEPYSGTIVLRVKDNEGATSTDSAYVEVGAGSLLAEVDVNPDVLNPKSEGNWVTSYIELPEGYAAENIDVSTVTLDGIISAESSPTQVGDHDDDGIPDLMVKFDRQTLIGYLGEATGEVTLTLMGDVDGKPFEGSDTIMVIGQEKE